MKAIKNKVQLIGHLGADPEIKIFKEDNKLANMRLAVNDRYKNAKGEWVEETQWFNLVAWAKLANYAEKYLLKGIEVAVEGRLLTKSYTDKNAVKRMSTDIVVSEILILTKKNAVGKELV
jgi:single-strand DNA-binding protein